MKEREPQPSSGFEFTDNERLFDRVSQRRFDALVFDPATTIHEVKTTSNSYGKFLFLSSSRPKEKEREYITFFGCGLHEYRDRWYVDEWHFYSSSPYGDLAERSISHDEARRLLAERRAEIMIEARHHQQSKRGQMFEMMAEISDDDGTISDFEDFGGLLSGLFDDEE